MTAVRLARIDRRRRAGRACIAPLIIVALVAAARSSSLSLLRGRAADDAGHSCGWSRERRFPHARAQATAPSSGRAALASLGAQHACRAGRARRSAMPFWFVPPLVLIVPPLIWGWLTYRVMSFDVLADHASVDERRAPAAPSTAGRCSCMGIACGYLGAAPSLVWAIERADRCVFAPLLDPGRDLALHPGLRVLRRSGSRTTRWPRCERMRGRTRRHAVGSPPVPPPRDRCRPDPCSTHSLPEDPARMAIGLINRRRRNPVGQARGQALPKVVELLGGARLPLAWADTRRRPGAHHRHAHALRLRRPRVLLRRHRRHAGRPHAPMRRRRPGRGAALHPGAQTFIRERMRDIAREQRRRRTRPRRQHAPPEDGRVPGGRRAHSQPVQQDRRASVRGRRHHFVPGFPVMAWPMIEWVLDTQYRAETSAPGPCREVGDRLRRVEATLTP